MIRRSAHVESKVKNSMRRSSQCIAHINLFNLHTLTKNQSRKALLEYGERSLNYVAKKQLEELFSPCYNNEILDTEAAAGAFGVIEYPSYEFLPHWD